MIHSERGTLVPLWIGLTCIYGTKVPCSDNFFALRRLPIYRVVCNHLKILTERSDVSTSTLLLTIHDAGNEGAQGDIEQKEQQAILPEEQKPGNKTNNAQDESYGDEVFVLP